ncbi:MAG TPA: ATP-binding protein [Gammaproteobacteria bacterium]
MKRLSLRLQLLAVSVLTFALPWAGWRYVTEMETALRNGLEQSLAASAVTIANALARADFPFASLERHELDGSVYAHPLRSAPTLDGNRDDWDLTDAHGRTLGPGQRYWAGEHERYAYLFVDVTDEHVVHQRVPGQPPYGDRVALNLGRYGELWLLLQTAAPGALRAQLTAPNAFIPTAAFEERVNGWWAENARGYAVEIRLPLELLGGRLGVAVLDVDPGAVGHEVAVASSWPLGEKPPGAFLQRLDGVAAAARPYEQPGRRLRILDPGGFVLYDAGALETPEAVATGAGPDASAVERVLRALLRRDDPPYRELEQPPGYLADPALREALAGRTVSRWYRRTDASAVVAAAVPIPVPRSAAGAPVVLLEQASDAILTVTDAALLRLMVITLAASLAAAAALLGFATVLSLRVRRLARAAEHALGPRGEISTALPGQRAADEIGDLSRSFAQLLKRLREYTEYLRTLKGKLAHELRTPLAVISSSLDNIEREPDGASLEPYLERIREGAKRLDGLIAAMSEATAIEQAVAEARPERFALAAVVQGCVEGYRSAFRDRVFAFHAEEPAREIDGSPELVAQLLDKLVDNAVSFSPSGSTIDVRVASGPDEVTLSVRNVGPPLPERMRNQLFDSLVSVREAGGARRHLGLGLYIAALIARFHGGRIEADNAPDGSGVVVTVTLPA